MRSLPGKVVNTKIGDRQIPRDEAGFLLNPDDWDKHVALFLAEEENIVLQDDHWPIIHFIRQHLQDHTVAPDARFVFAYIARTNSISKKQARRDFFEIFPYGYVKQACKIAGLRQPRGWSTG